jgi:hypothetical protein
MYWNNSFNTAKKKYQATAEMKRWISTTERNPQHDGRYWVFPYRSLGGHLMVTMATFKDGEWITTSRKQEYAFWKPLDIPKAPYLKESRLKDYEKTYDEMPID